MSLPMAVLILGSTGSGKTPLGEYIEQNGLNGIKCHHFDFGACLRRISGFGKGFGAWLGILSALDIDYQDPVPRQWQKRFDPNLPKDKQAKKQAVWEQAQALFPGVKVYKYAADAFAMLSLLMAEQVANTPVEVVELEDTSNQMELF